METIAVTIKYFFIMLFGLIALACFADGAIFYGIVSLVLCVVLTQIKPEDQETEETPIRSMSTNGILTKVTEADGPVTVYAHKKFNGTQEDIEAFAKGENK